MTSYCTLLFISVILCVTCAKSKNMLETESNQQASYHLEMLKQDVDRIKKALSSHSQRGTRRVSKRSTKMDADDLILHSLSSYCQAFKSDPGLSEYLERSSQMEPLKYRDLSKYSRYVAPERMIDNEQNIVGNEEGLDDNARVSFQILEPKSIPVKVLAQRESDKVWFMIHVAHSSPVGVARVDDFQFQRKILNIPDDVCYKIVSKTRFAVDVSSDYCQAGKYTLRELQASFRIYDEGSKSEDSLTIYTDMCKFDKEWDNINDRIATEDEIMSQNEIPIPKLSIAHMNDTTFEIKVNISEKTHLSLKVVLWDNSTMTDIVQSSANINLNTEKHVQYEHGYDNETKLFEVEVLSERNNDHGIEMHLRIVLSADHTRDRSGRFSVRYEKRTSESSSFSSPIVTKVQVDRSFPVNLAEEASNEIPEGLVYFSPKRRFSCDKNGLRDKYGSNSDNENKNCTLKCEAFGRGISTIYITKTQPIATPVKSTSFVFPSNAIAIVDVGRSSGDVGGEYQCIAVNNYGTSKTHDFNLYTSRFTKIDSFHLDVDGDDFFKAICVVKGDPNGLDIAISVSFYGSSQTRLDNVDGGFLAKNITYDSEQDTITMVLDISWTEAKRPRDQITCTARGPRGEDSTSRLLTIYKQNYIGVFPAINTTLFTIDYMDLRAVVSCTAVGQLPMTVTIEYGGIDYQDEDDVTVKSYTEGGDTMTVKYILPFHYLTGERARDFRCTAKNDFYRDEAILVPDYDLSSLEK